MRWFLTNAHPLADALVAAGESVVSTPADHQTALVDWLGEAVDALPEPPVPWWTPRDHRTDPVTAALLATRELEHPNDYPVRRLLQREDPDVVVVTPLLQPRFGVSKGGVMRWANMGKRVIVGVAHDPGTLAAARANSWRGCTITPANCHVYVTNHVESAQASARERRTVFWQPGMDASTIVDVVRSARSGRSYMAGSRGKPFGI